MSRSEPTAPQSSEGAPVTAVRRAIDPTQMADVLLERLAEHIAAHEASAARETVEDVFWLIDHIDDDSERAGRSLALGEVLLSLEDGARARERFEDAASIFDRTDDPASLARSLFGLGRALTMLHDPVGRTILEDAGTLFAELGDEVAARAVDLELRHLADEIDEAPRSSKLLVCP